MNTSNNNHPMSLTKRNPAFDRMMEEQRELDDLSYERYSEEQYFGVPVRKASPSASASKSSPKTAPGFPTTPSREYPNVHDKVGTKEDVFGMLGRVFGHNK